MSTIRFDRFTYTDSENTPLSLPGMGVLHIWWADAGGSPHKSGQSRRILLKLVSRYLHVPEKDVRIEAGAHGKPYLASPDGVPLFFNLSHAGEKMAFLFSTEGEVGIDLETLDHPGDLDRIAARFFHPDEIRELEAAPDTEKRRAFFRIWTKKEALLKGQGTGLTRETSAFSFTPLQDGSWQVKKSLREDDASWRLYEIAAPDGYVCTAAHSAT